MAVVPEGSAAVCILQVRLKVAIFFPQKKGIPEGSAAVWILHAGKLCLPKVAGNEICSEKSSL